jgi:signal transduction histidine kinase
MELTRRSLTVYGLLVAVWVLVAGWQVEEHIRFKNSAKADLRNRSTDIANTLGAFIRGLRFRGTVFPERLEPVLNELVNSPTNEVVKSSELVSIALLNAAGEPIAAAGRPLDLSQAELLQKGERWGLRSVTLVSPVDLGSSVTSEGVTNPTIVLPPFREFTNAVREGRGFPRHEGKPDGAESSNAPPGSAEGPDLNAPPPPPPEHDMHRKEGEARPRRPFFLRNIDEKEYQALIEKRAIHGVVLGMSTASFQAASTRDLWLRFIIVGLATILVAGSGMIWHNLARVSDLQIRLVRASELNTHLKELNLAAAGLAHETRNPLNIIRGLAQMVSKRQDAPEEIRIKSREILNETDKVTAQLNEFINYSRPREVRPAPLPLKSIVNEVARTLSYDLEEKKIQLQVKGEPLDVEADEQLLRQALFNLLLNAVQAVDGNGVIEVVTEKRSAAEAQLEVRDNGPGVPPDRRAEIFKPYFTTQKTGTGLGLAVVQQIVLAHGWEIQCLANDPKGAIFRITHLKLAS